MLILEDATVPRSELAGMVRDVQRIAEEEGLLIAVFGHAGDGNLHPTCCIDDRDPDQLARVHRAFDRIFKAALARGGTITGEHGIGLDKLPYMSAIFSPESLGAMCALRDVFDPERRANPGKVVPIHSCREWHAAPAARPGTAKRA
jgi:glycolate oxidase